jgi:hypothetical protein
MKPTGEGAAVGKILFMSGGLLIWALHFTVIYGFTTVACVGSFATTTIFGMGVVPFTIAIVTVASWAGVGAVLWLTRTRPAPPHDKQSSDSNERFFRYISALIAILSLVAIAWNALPGFMLKPC